MLPPITQADVSEAADLLEVEGMSHVADWIRANAPTCADCDRLGTWCPSHLPDYDDGKDYC